MIKRGILLLLPLLIGSCVHHKELVNFPSENVVLQGTEAIDSILQLKVEPNDLLQIRVHSINPEASAPFNIETGNQQNVVGNQLGANTSANYTMELFNGYLVDFDGQISFPVVGKMKVSGKTLTQVEELLTANVKTYLKDAVVNVRFLNFKITVIGEVGRPGIVRISNQRITLLEALANAGDFTPYANRSNVLLIREENGQRTYQRLDFQSGELFKSPYFYLKQNDVLYIEPTRAKVATVADPFQRGISYGSAFLSFITLIIAVFR